MDVELPEDIHRRVLQSPSLSLADLALLAPTCQCFRQVFREVRAAEEAWLDELRAAAESMFGPRVLAALCDWLFSWMREDFSNPNPDPYVCTRIDITEGSQHPPPPGSLDVPGWRDFILYAPAWGLRVDGGEYNVLCSGHVFSRGAERWMDLGPGRRMALKFRLGGPYYVNLSGTPAALVPVWIGFLHRVLEAEARMSEGQGGRILRSKGERRRDLILGLPTVDLLGRSPRCNAAVKGGGEVQRAISALLMRHWPRWKIKISNRAR